MRKTFPLKITPFDVVVTRNLVWTLPNPEAAVKEWHRVLKPGGRIIISDGYWCNTTWLRVHHLLSKTVKSFLKTRSLISCRFFFHYASLIHSLPLYEGVTLKLTFRLFPAPFQTLGKRRKSTVFFDNV